MTDQIVRLTLEEATSRLPDRDKVHTIRQRGGFLFGADWDRADLLAHIEKYGAEESGQYATNSGHGICLMDDSGWLFIETGNEGEP